VLIISLCAALSKEKIMHKRYIVIAGHPDSKANIWMRFYSFGQKVTKSDSAVIEDGK
jgi:hypothetical protein